MGVTLRYASMQDLEAEVANSMQAYLGQVLPQARSEIAVVHGWGASQETIETAKMQQVDLIVMGTHGRNVCNTCSWAAWQKKSALRHARYWSSVSLPLCCS